MRRRSARGGGDAAREIGLWQVGGIHEDESLHAIDLDDTNRHERVTIGTGKVDVEQDDLALRLVDQQIADDAELAAAHRANLPAANVGFAWRYSP